MNDIKELVTSLIKEVTDMNVTNIFLWCDEDDIIYENIINNLTKENNALINQWIWDNTQINDEYDVLNSSLSEISKELITKLIEVSSNWYQQAFIKIADKPEQIIYRNINDKVEGKRIVLVNVNDYEDMIGSSFLEELANEIRYADDFEEFYSIENQVNLEKALMINTYVPHGYVIIEKETNKSIGLVNARNKDLDFSKVLDVAELSYYIYKDYRKKGYAKEAVELFVREYFNGNLKSYYETDRKYALEVKYNNPVCLKISCNKKNIGSQKVAESVGFLYEGTKHYELFLRDEPLHFISYYMDKEIYQKKIK